MALVDLTTKCFQNGVPAKKWVGLCKLLKKQTPISDAEFEGSLCNSILNLFRSNPGDLSLQAYIEAALHDGLVTLRVFTAIFLQAAKSPNLQEISTLDNLSRMIVNHHYASGLPSSSSFMRVGETASDVMPLVSDSLTLLRSTSQMPSSPYHALSSSVGRLAMALVHCAADLTLVSNQLLVVPYAAILDILETVRLDDDVRNALENFFMSLSLIIGDDIKMNNEVQVMQTMQVSLGRTDATGAGAPTDLVSCSLLLRHLVMYRTSTYGSGNLAGAVAMLIGNFRWSQWSPAVYYTQLLHAAISCLAQGSFHQYTSRVWTSFIIARLPTLLSQLELALKGNADSAKDSEWKSALQQALIALKSHPDLLALCDAATPRTYSDEMDLDITKPNSTTSVPFFCTFLKVLMVNGSLDKEVARRIEPDVSLAPSPTLKVEATENGQDVNTYIDSKLSAEASFDDACAFLDRTLQDVSNHAIIAIAIKNRFDALCANRQDASSVEGLSLLCKSLSNCTIALDVIALQVKITDIVAAALSFVDTFDCELVGDPQTAVGHFGNVVLFLQSTVVRYQLSSFQFSYNKQPLRADYLLSTSSIFKRPEFNGEEVGAYMQWVKALFDSNSEGIEDSILRSTKPKTLLKLAATLINTALRFYFERKIDLEVLNNGISYFKGELLNWTLVGVVKSLLQEILHRDFSDSWCPLCFDILQSLVESPTCPKPVLCLTGHGILAILDDRKAPEIKTATFKPEVLRKAVHEALGSSPEDSLTDPVSSPLSLASPQPSYLEQPRLALRDAFSAARSGKAPSLDVSRGVLVLGPSKYLRLLWSELLAALQLGGTDMELCRRVATHALTCPPPTSVTLGYSGRTVPPLLPLFLHGGMLHGLLHALDGQLPAEQSMNVELLVSVLTSALNAVLHLEWALALRTVDAPVEMKHPMGQTSAMLARRLNADLKRSTCTSAATILQRLASTASFVANFPIMAM